MTSKFTELAIDCADPRGLARFWWYLPTQREMSSASSRPAVPDRRQQPDRYPPKYRRGLATSIVSICSSVTPRDRNAGSTLSNRCW
jgi:hypothetical protein